MGGHLITSMNHSQIAPVQPDSGVVLPAWSWEPAWVRQTLGGLSVWQESGGLGQASRPLLSLCLLWPHLPHAACRIHHCCSAVLSGLLRPGRGAELTPPDPATPTPRYLAPAGSSRPLQQRRPFLLLFPASSRPRFVCSCFFSVSPCLSSLSPGCCGGGGVPRPSSSDNPAQT